MTNEKKKGKGKAATGSAPRNDLEKLVADRTRALAVANEELRVHAQQWKATFDAFMDGVFLLDTQGTILRCNQAMAELVGASTANIVGHRCTEVMHGTTEAPRVCPYVEMVKTRRRAVSIVPVGERWFEVVTDPIFDTGGDITGAVHIMYDITRRRIAEDARDAAERELQRQRIVSLRTDRLRSLGEMAAGIAHELNQPLSGVRGLAEHLLIGLRRGWDMGPEGVRDKLGLIVDQVDRMDHIVDHIRKFAREAGRQQAKPVEVNDVIRSSLRLMEHQMRARNLDVELELADGLPLVSVNPYSLEEVILNLLANARDAVEERREKEPSCAGRVLVRSVLGGTDAGRPVEIQVEDEGAGIPPGLAPRLFEPFFTTKGPDKGTGLGLSICRSIVEEFGGAIDLESSPGKGATATVRLPVSAA